MCQALGYTLIDRILDFKQGIRLPGWLAVKNPPANAGKSHGWRSLVGCSPWGRSESDMTERLHFHFSLSCIGEGNGNPLQGSCLENPRDGGAWWAAVYGVAQSRTRLKRLSSSSSNATHSSVLAWRIPWTEETDRLQSMGRQKSQRHD